MMLRLLFVGFAVIMIAGCYTSPSTEHATVKNTNKTETDRQTDRQTDITSISSVVVIPAASSEMADELNKLQKEINSIEKVISEKENNSPFFLNLPEKLYALVGEELNVYFDNLVDGHDTDYDFNVSCSIGMQLERCFRVVPDEAGEYPFSIRVTDKNGKSFVRKSTIYVADTSAGKGKECSIIIIGDSITDNGACVERLNFNFANDPMGLRTIGTRGTEKHKHEGRAGWSFKKYYTIEQDSTRSDVLNPFFNPDSKTFDATYYFSKTKVAKPDWFFINLGSNDTFSYVNDDTLNDAIVELNMMYDDMIKSLKAASPETKIGIVLTIPPNYSQDAFGKAAKNVQTRSRYKRNNVIWVNNLLNHYSNRENEQIFIVPIHTNLDTKNNMGLESIPCNKRNPETYSSPVAGGAIHPAISGYWQISDVYWFFLKAMEQYPEKGIDEK